MINNFRNANISAFDNYLPINRPPLPFHLPTNRGVKCRATSAAKNGKYSMENFICTKVNDEFDSV